MRSLAILLAMILPSLALGQTTVSHFSLRNQSAVADFISTDTSTCALGVETLVSVAGSSEAVKDGSTTVTPFASVIVSVFDFCRNTAVLFASGDTTIQSLRINPNLKLASLQATVPLFNYTTGGTITAGVDLVWNGANKADRSSSNTVDRSGGTTLVSFSSGAIREAEAAGSVVIDGIDYTPKASIDAFIERDAAREVTVTHE